MGLEDADARIDALYDLPLPEFVAARNQLAKDLSRAGDKARASEVKALLKPPVSAFALNQLVRRHRAAVDAFLKSSDRMARAQLRVMSGAGSDADFRAAVAAQKKALDQMLELAAPILEDAGHPVTRGYLERIARTLRGLVLDEAQRALFEAGRLSADLAEPGFDALSALSSSGVIAGEDEDEPAPPAAPPAVAVKPAPKPVVVEDPPPQPEDRTALLRAALAEARAIEAEARRTLRELEKTAAESRDRFDSIRAELTTAEAAQKEAQRALDAAAAIVDQRRARAEEREKATRQAEAQADAARSALLQASRAVEAAESALSRVKRGG